MLHSFETHTTFINNVANKRFKYSKAQGYGKGKADRVIRASQTLTNRVVVDEVSTGTGTHLNEVATKSIEDSPQGNPR